MAHTHAHSSLSLAPLASLTCARSGSKAQRELAVIRSQSPRVEDQLASAHVCVSLVFVCGVEGRMQEGHCCAALCLPATLVRQGSARMRVSVEAQSKVAAPLVLSAKLVIAFSQSQAPRFFVCVARPFFYRCSLIGGGTTHYSQLDQLERRQDKPWWRSTTMKASCGCRVRVMGCALRERVRRGAMSSRAERCLWKAYRSAGLRCDRSHPCAAVVGLPTPPLVLAAADAAASPRGSLRAGGLAALATTAQMLQPRNSVLCVCACGIPPAIYSLDRSQKQDDDGARPLWAHHSRRPPSLLMAACSRGTALAPKPTPPLSPPFLHTIKKHHAP